MSETNTPDVVPAYGEAGPEAESMDKAADGKPGNDAANTSEKVLPDDVLVESTGTTEVNIPARIAETADRAAQSPD